MEDKEIVGLYLSRNEDAVRYTAEKYGSRLRSLAKGILQDEPSAEECENDTYLKAWNAIPPHDPAAYLYAFLARITRHLCLDRCRSRTRLKRGAHMDSLSAELEACIPAPDDTACKLEYKELGEAISRYLYTLSEEKQIIFMRRYWYLDSVETIAQRLGIGQSKVKIILFRCRNGLKEYLVKEGYDL